MKYEVTFLISLITIKKKIKKSSSFFIKTS